MGKRRKPHNANLFNIQQQDMSIGYAPHFRREIYPKRIVNNPRAIRCRPKRMSLVPTVD